MCVLMLFVLLGRSAYVAAVVVTSHRPKKKIVGCFVSGSKIWLVREEIKRKDPRGIICMFYALPQDIKSGHGRRREGHGSDSRRHAYPISWLSAMLSIAAAIFAGEKLSQQQLSVGRFLDFL